MFSPLTNIFMKNFKMSMKVITIFYNNRYFLVYFLVKGLASYVLPKYNDKEYLKINEGESFGLVDLGSEKNFLNQKSNKK